MNGVQWWMWLLGGMATGAIGLVGENRILGYLQAAIVIGSPFFIFSTVGATIMPFVLFYGGLAAVSSLLFKRRTAAENKAREASLEAKKKRWG